MREGQKGIFFILNEMQSLDAVSGFDKVAAQCRRTLRPDSLNSAIMSLWACPNDSPSAILLQCYSTLKTPQVTMTDITPAPVA